jgi:predicted Rossmann-fold nucleotide-binding protein
VPPPRAWIAVAGPGEAAPWEVEAAEEAGAAVAEAGCGLVCGGLGGVMEAACRGAGWVLVALPTGLGEARNALVVRTADAVVAIGGGWGTLSEIALALKAGIPVVGVGTWEPTRGGGMVEGVVAVDDPRAAVAEALRLSRH